ncbi:hypothetical protein E4N62_26210 [Streptomyces sp. MNU76]|uniref:hypothetical protein n=1 Tax=Streptomyces sp. MNU76 TaxID=2560026 RepID=UPI001E5A4828|nr:hypothetical protein [Streptomyces sp. MNU76]MCC9708448.1 hypothetical protein [Streptomyces sp. MNU76]
MSRFDYGGIVPWLRPDGRRLQVIAGPDHLTVDSGVDFDVHPDGHAVSEFEVSAGDAVHFHLGRTAGEQGGHRHEGPGTILRVMGASWLGLAAGRRRAVPSERRAMGWGGPWS